MNFADRLQQAIEHKRNPVLLGLDPHLDLLPEEFAVARDPRLPRSERAQLVQRFCCELIDLAADRVPAVKPQSAFFEVLGADGALAWENVIAHARSRGLIVIGDVKRGDIASTAAAYAQAHLAPPDSAQRGRCDAITVNPYLGPDALEPFIETCRRHDAGLFVLVRTSNPGGRAWQELGQPSLAERVAETLNGAAEGSLGASGLSPFGAVLGATQGSELGLWRQRLPRSFLLLPGYGAQGAGPKDIVEAFLPGGRGALVAASRSIAFAYQTDAQRALDWKGAARAALLEMVQQLSSVLSSGGAG